MPHHSPDPGWRALLRDRAERSEEEVRAVIARIGPELRRAVDAHPVLRGRVAETERRWERGEIEPGEALEEYRRIAHDLDQSVPAPDGGRHVQRVEEIYTVLRICALPVEMIGEEAAPYTPSSRKTNDPLLLLARQIAALDGAGLDGASLHERDRPAFRERLRALLENAPSVDVERGVEEIERLFGH